MTRRSLVAGVTTLGVGGGLDRVASALASGEAGSGSSDRQAPAIPFHGVHQAGIATPRQAHLHFAAFDVLAESAPALRGLLARWSAAAAALTAGQEYDPRTATPPPPRDPGEAVGLPPTRLTLTFGLGPSLFESGGRDRFGLARRRPPLLAPLPPFPGDDLDPARCGGDLCVQACADDPQVAFHAVHVLSLIAGGDAVIRWAQRGFWPPAPPPSTAPAPPPSPGGARTARNLLGFKDGTDNIPPDDPRAMSRYVWVGRGHEPAWMAGGTYLIVRRIEIVFSSWDALSLAQQEQTIGRHKRSGAPLGRRREGDPLDLQALTPQGTAVIPSDAHVRVASPESNHGERILRRSYSYSSGFTPGTLDRGGHQIEGGLFFVAFVRDPQRQFVPLQRRLATGDALSAFTLPTGSAIFACPPGARVGGFVGQGLLEPVAG